MPQSRLHDLVFLLGLSLTACGPGDGNDPDPGDRNALDDALDACRPFAQAMTACGGESESYGYVSAVGYCVAQVGYTQQVPACADAYRDLFACFADLDCEQLEGDDDDVVDEGETEPEPDPCEAEELAIESACESLFGDEG